MYQNYNGNGNGAVHLCSCCFKSYRTRDLLTEHLKNGCAKYGERAICPTRAKAKNHVKFKNIARMLKKPFVLYADFEYILEKCGDKRNVKSKLYQKHTACGYSYKRVSTLEKYAKDIVLYRAEDDHENVAELFVNNLLKEARNHENHEKYYSYEFD